MGTARPNKPAAGRGEVIKRIPTGDMDRFIDICILAYPGIPVRSKTERAAVRTRMMKRNRDPRVSVWGCYRSGELVGGLRLFDYTMNLHGVPIPVGGGGSLAVALEHKKEHVARDLMTHFIDHYRKKKTPLAILYPFRPDFYRAMGFGYGSKLHQYRIRPVHLPDSPARRHVRLLTKADLPALRRCYHRRYERNSGMIAETAYGWSLIFEYGKHRYAGYFENGELRGYAAFAFEPAAPDDFIRNNLRVAEIAVDDGQALAGLLAFLRSQRDQIDYIILDTFENNFHFLPVDPRCREHMFAPIYHETNLSGVGLMYKVIDIPAMFAALAGHSFGGQSATVGVTVTDTFTPANQGRYVIRFTEGKPAVVRRTAADVDISLDIAQFSSLLIGAVGFKELYRYDLAEISDPTWVERMHALFRTDDKPVCVTQF
jgi:predicted acetyltransferase